jgi:hypothetical protein
MFYLKEWGATLVDLRLRGLFFVVTALALATGLAFRPALARLVQELSPEAYARPYFTALFDNSIDVAEVLGQLRARPEVAEVQPVGAREAGGALAGLLDRLGTDYRVKDGQLAAFGLRVILKEGAKVSGEKLRANLEAGIGTEHITVSDIREPRVGRLFGSHPIFRYLAGFGVAGVLAPLFLAWIAAYTLCFAHFTRRAWLVERFQRRRLVRAKTLAAGLGAVAALALVASIVVQGPDLVGVVLLVSVFSVPWALSMREARWRV